MPEALLYLILSLFSHSLISLLRSAQQEIHYDSARGGVSVLTEAGEVTRSALLIQKATRQDAGNYTCQPKGAASATAYVHVLHGRLCVCVCVCGACKAMSKFVDLAV